MLEHHSLQASKPTRVVVIGAGGFVGGALLKRFTQEGVNTLPLTRKELNLLEDGAATTLKDILKPTDSVVMVSAVAPAKTVSMMMENLRMAESVCEGLSSVEIAHLVYVSSDAVYADEANPVHEGSPLAPSTLHGMMHAARELMLKTATRAPVAILRPTLIYGATDPHNGYGPNRFRRQAAKGEAIHIFGEGEEQRDHVLIEDVATITSLVLAHRSSGSLNVVTGISKSFRTIADMVAEQCGGTVVSHPRPGPRPHLLHRFFDITQTLKAFPTFRYTPLAEGLILARQAL